MKTLLRLLGARASHEPSNRLVRSVSLLVTLLVLVALSSEQLAQAEEVAAPISVQTEAGETPLLLAQAITPGRDRTNTRVRVRGDRIDIDGGTRSNDGANLFHSFERFGLSRNQIANFLANPQIRNILGRVTGGEVSRINGLIRVSGGNANLFLINPAGILFGADARLDVAGDFTATTADRIGFGDRWLNAIGNADYANLLGNPSAFAFTSAQPGAILNEGNLAVGVGQNLNLMGGNVVNTGTLSAPGGQITVTAVPGTNRVEIRQEGTLLVLEVQPLGSDDLANPLPFTPESLPTVLTGGSDNPATGVTVNPDGTVQLTASNTVIPTTPGTAIVSGTVDVSSPGSESNQTGGTVGVFGTQVGLVGATVNASGTHGGGTVLIGGDYLGQGTVPNAQMTSVSADSTLNADATVSGNGGRVIVWADDATRFLGSITARGGVTGGDGGFVETSGARSLDTSSAQVNASAANGIPGTWLLDPSDITIQTGGTGMLVGGLFDPPTAGMASIIDPLMIEAALDGGTNVTITTSSGTGGVGDIRLQDPINQSGGGTASLTLTGSDSFSFALGSTINLTSTGGLTFNVNQVNNQTIVNGGVIQAVVDAIGTVAGSSTINLGEGSYQLNTGLSITKPLTINGAGAATTILDGQLDVSQVLNLSGAGVTLNLNELSLEGGLQNGISISGATLNLSNSNVRDNSFAANFSGSGAGILNDSTGTVNVTGSTISGNFSSNFGGGIFNQGLLTVTNSTISGNSANNGGGIHNDRFGTATLIGSTLTGNSSTAFGGGFNNQGTLTVTNSTISGNSAVSGGGGIFNTGDGSPTITGSTLNNNSAGTDGGGILNSGDDLTITGSTLSNNSALESGGGIHNAIGGTVTLTGSTLNGNSATSSSPGSGEGGGISNQGTLTIASSTIRNNTATDNGGGINTVGEAIITDSTISGNTTSSSGGNTTFGGGVFSSLSSLDITNTVFSNNTASGVSSSLNGLLSISNPVTVGSANLSLSAAGVLQSTGDFRLTSSEALDISTFGRLVTQGRDVFLEAADSVFVNSTIATNGGAVRLIGDTDDNGQGRVEINQAIDTSGGTSGGAITIRGSSVNNPGILVNAASLTSGGGNVSLTGTSTNENGISLGGAVIAGEVNPVFLTSGGGNVSLTGTSTNENGISLGGAVIAGEVNPVFLTSGGGNVSLTGTSTNENGISLERAVISSNGGDVSLTGSNNFTLSTPEGLNTQGGNVGIEVEGNLNINAAIATNGGAVRLIGDTDNNGQGRVQINQAIDTSGAGSGGAITVQGSSVDNSGIFVNDVSLTSGGGNVSLTGTSTNRDGIALGDSVISSNGGNVSLTGSNNFTLSTPEGLNTQGGNVAIEVGGNLNLNAAIATNGGTVRLIGDTDNNGQGQVVINQAIDTSGAGSGGAITVQGNSVDNSGIQIDGSSLISGGAPITLTGTSINGSGIGFNGLGSINSGSGDVSITGTSTNSQGIALTGEINSGGGNVTLSANRNIATRSILTVGGDLQITSSESDINTTGGTLSTSGSFANSGAIALSAINASISTGDLDASWSDDTGGINGNAGSVSVIARDRIITGNINTSSTQGNGGDVTLDPSGDVQVGFINAEGNGGTGGSVDITTGRFFRALRSFTAQNGAIASISTAGTAGNGTITIRHGGGQRDVPFRVGNAETNGTAAALTTGAFSLANRDIPGSFSQGGIRIITRDSSPNGPNEPNRPDTPTEDVSTRDLIKPDDQQSPPQSPSELIPDNVTIDARNNSSEVIADLEETNAAQFESYLGIPEQAPILTSADVGEALDLIKTETGVTPCLIYINFVPASEQPLLAQGGGGNIPVPEGDRDQLELVLMTSDQEVIRKTVPGATRGRVLAIARQFRSAMIDPSDRQSTATLMASSQQLYQWLIAPLEAELQQRGIQNLSFVLDRGLGSLPLAALNDGNQFLVEKYSIGLMPAISLVDTRYVSIRDTQVLAMGASQFPQFPDLSDLPAVSLELSTIRQNQWRGSFSQQNTDFTVNTLQSERQAVPYGILHLATHANFQPGQSSNSYIQFENQRVQFDQLRGLDWNNPPIELLVLSACRTALGNEEAELGFAGAALQARVKTVLASLWSVSDLGSSGLMAEFYAQLRTAPIKAEALRAAQLAMLRGDVYVQAGQLHWSGGEVPLPPDLAGLADANFTHPYYWSAFTLIGSPW